MPYCIKSYINLNKILNTPVVFPLLNQAPPIQLNYRKETQSINLLLQTTNASASFEGITSMAQSCVCSLHYLHSSFPITVSILLSFVAGSIVDCVAWPIASYILWSLSSNLSKAIFWKKIKRYPQFKFKRLEDLEFFNSRAKVTRVGSMGILSMKSWREGRTEGWREGGRVGRDGGEGEKGRRVEAKGREGREGERKGRREGGSIGRDGGRGRKEGR